MFLTTLAALGTGALNFASTAGGGALLGGTVGALGSLGSSMMNSASASHTAAKSFYYSKALYDYQMRRSLLDSPRMQMQGLRDAGVNPMVAYGNLGYSGSMPSFNAPMPDVGLDLSSLSNGISAYGLHKSQLENEKQNREINWERLGLDKLSMQNNTARVQAEIDNIKQDTLNKMAINPKIAAEIRNINSQTALNEALGKMHNSTISLNAMRERDLLSQIRSRGILKGDPESVREYAGGWLDNLVNTYNYIRGLNIGLGSSASSNRRRVPARKVVKKSPKPVSYKTDETGKVFADFARRITNGR